jgi:hypothetical protein
MNSINKKFEKFIISEAKKLSEKENINLHLKEDKQTMHEFSCGCGSCKHEEPEFIKIEFEPVDSEEFIKESKEVKMLSEELDRMKQLLSFNNPLLKK